MYCPKRIFPSEDMFAYKVLVKAGEKTFLSPFRTYAWEVGVTEYVYTPRSGHIPDYPIPKIQHHLPMIEENVFHAYLCYSEALGLCQSFNRHYSQAKYVVAKVRIPKNSEYIYVGYDYLINDGKPPEEGNVIASHSMEVVEIIRKDEYVKPMTAKYVYV